MIESKKREQKYKQEKYVKNRTTMWSPFSIFIVNNASIIFIFVLTSFGSPHAQFMLYKLSSHVCYNFIFSFLFLIFYLIKII